MSNDQQSEIRFDGTQVGGGCTAGTQPIFRETPPPPPPPPPTPKK